MLLTIMGSGETSPTMVTHHRVIADRLPTGASAVLIETPYGFQENVAEISARACQYFARSVGLTVHTAPGLRGAGNDPVPGDADRGLAMIRSAGWLFSGPGSPTYATRWWTTTPVADALHDRLRHRRGSTVFASAAAATLGRWTVPVYEIYKAGEPPRWADGLDLLRHLDLRVALVPHYDNTEGGTHDTRFCYLGERRLQIMERDLPDDAAVLGIDEHTAVSIDPDTDRVRVTGRGALTVRRHSHDTVLPAGTELTLTELRGLAHHGTLTRALPPRTDPDEPAQAPAVTVTEVATDCERRFDEALARRDADAMAGSILDLEATIHAWSTDTEEDDGAPQARAVLRTLILRMAHTAVDGLADPAERLRPLTETLITVRDSLRRRHDFPHADALRTALAVVGIELHDSPDGTHWSLRTVTTPMTS